MRLPAALLLSLLALPSIAAAQEVLGRSERRVEITRMVPNGADVRFFGVTGDLTVTEGSAGRVTYRAEKRERDGRIEDIAFAVVSDANGVTICAIFDDDDQCSRDGLQRARRNGNRWGQRASVRITVEVPSGVRLRASSGNGDVAVSVAARELHVSSGNGDVRVTRADGPVRASTGNGDVIVATTRGPVTASSGNGDIRVEMDRLADESDMEFSSGNGDVIVTVPADLRADLIASTGNGSIRTDLPIEVVGKLSRYRMQGTINGGGRRLRLSSGNGQVELRRRS